MTEPDSGESNAATEDIIDLDQDATVGLGEYLEVISTEDKRMKIIGEELANDTGRAIFVRICQGAVSPVELAKSLDISMPLVNWHINRLLSVDLIRIAKVSMSSKNRGVKHYAPTKTIIVIVPPEQNVDGSTLNFRKMVKKLNRNIIGIVSFISGTLAVYFGSDALRSSGGIVLGDPDMSGAVFETAIVSLVGGAIIAGLVYLAGKVSKNKDSG